MDKILTIVGPTAVGKTQIAIEIARKISGEIISADSRQIYKYLDIGTAKPTAQEGREINFQLIDIVDPNENYSCGQFRRDAEAAIEEIKERNNVPIVCGGTGLYIKALFNPLHELPESVPPIKENLTRLFQKHGAEYLYKKLQVVDPAWAEKIKSNDRQRILRGLEVYEITGKPLSQLIKQKREKPTYQPHYIGLILPRADLYRKIDQRFDKMMDHGLVDEVKALLKKGFDPDSNALRTIGYKEIIEFLEGKRKLNEAAVKIKQRTRNFAKRQITWFCKIPGISWFDPGHGNLVNKIVESFLKGRHHK